MAIEKIREKIDAIDDQILDLLKERLEQGREIGTLKENAGLDVQDFLREKDMLERLSARSAKLAISDALIYHLYAIIMAATRDVQRPRSIVYLGPEATNTHMAALQHFDHVGRFVPKVTIAEIFHEVEKGSAHYGVVPVENSMEGAVNYTLDLLFTSSVKICGELCLNISHDLLSMEKDLFAVATVYSHPQAIAQCRGWLLEHFPQARIVETSSTGDAARKAASEPGVAAIAAPCAATRYQLHTLASNLGGSARNATRFLVLGKNDVAPTGQDKTTLIFVTSHLPGALYRSLQPLAEAGINLMKLESRPSPLENWHYFFVADLEGHARDEKVKGALAAMQQHCLFFKNAGSYPRSDCQDKA